MVLNPGSSSKPPRHWLYWGTFTTEFSSTWKADLARYSEGKRPIVRVIVLKPELVLPEAGAKGFLEGACGQVTRDVRERSKDARNACIKIFGYACAVCDMNFENRYGEIGHEFIHVHHRSSMSEKVGEYTVDPKLDLIPVCPNCHAMLHRRTPPYSIEDMRAFMAQRQSQVAVQDRGAIVE
jgi:5-methylcytosine-specific restriction protein A